MRRLPVYLVAALLAAVAGAPGVWAQTTLGTGGYTYPGTAGAFPNNTGVSTGYGTYLGSTTTGAYGNYTTPGQYGQYGPGQLGYYGQPGATPYGYNPALPSGYPGSAYPASGYLGSTYSPSGYPGSAYPGSGYLGSAYPGSGYLGSTYSYPGNYGAPGSYTPYAGPAGTYGYNGYSTPGYPGALPPYALGALPTTGYPPGYPPGAVGYGQPGTYGYNPLGYSSPNLTSTTGTNGNYVLGQYYYGVGVPQSTPYGAQTTITPYNVGALPALLTGHNVPIQGGQPGVLFQQPVNLGP